MVEEVKAEETVEEKPNYEEMYKEATETIQDYEERLEKALECVEYYKKENKELKDGLTAFKTLLNKI
jgi:predicted RNase H-like nuclease (RuvC/YqgF family)